VGRNNRKVEGWRKEANSVMHFKHGESRKRNKRDGKDKGSEA